MKHISTVLELLFAGHFICYASDKGAYETLSDEYCRHEIERVLSAMNRRLHSTNSNAAYYVTYDVIDDHNRSTVKEIIKSMHVIIRPLIKFIALVNKATNFDSVLCAGETISVPELVVEISSSKELIQELDRICRDQKVSGKKSKESIADKVQLIFGFLEREKIAILKDKNRQTYTLTGKLDLVYELIAFIDQNEKIVEQVNVLDKNQEVFDFD